MYLGSRFYSQHVLLKISFIFSYFKYDVITVIEGSLKTIKTVYYCHLSLCTSDPCWSLLRACQKLTCFFFNNTHCLPMKIKKKYTFCIVRLI